MKRGLVAAAGGLLRLPHRIPWQIAMELALTGEMLDAEGARQIGLVNHLTEEGKALDRALELAARIADNGPLAVIATKKIIVEHSQWPEPEKWSRQRAIIDPVMASEDAKEGAHAFVARTVHHRVREPLPGRMAAAFRGCGCLRDPCADHDRNVLASAQRAPTEFLFR